MNAILKYHFDELQKTTDALLDLVAALPSHRFFHIPASGRWSISQILTHLLTAERLSFLYLKKKSQGYKSFSNTGMVEEMKFLVLKISQRVPLRYKAPRVVLQNTPEALTYAELVAEWQTLRLDIQTFLETITDEDIRKKVYKHPRVGMLNVVHAIRFLREHVIHHLPQVRRIIKESQV